MDDSGGKDEKVEEKSRAISDLLERETGQLRTILHPVSGRSPAGKRHFSANGAATFLSCL